MPVAEDSRSEPSGHSAGEQRKAGAGGRRETGGWRKKHSRVQPVVIPIHWSSLHARSVFEPERRAWTPATGLDEGWMPEFRFLEGGSDRLRRLKRRKPGKKQR
jgi:hypothetical protein